MKRFMMIVIILMVTAIGLTIAGFMPDYNTVYAESGLPGGGGGGGNPVTPTSPIKSPLDECKSKTDGEGIICLVNMVIEILSVAVGAVAILMVVVAGVIYASAGDDSGKVSMAKKMITSAVLGTVLYIFLQAILNWIIPGGI